MKRLLFLLFSCLATASAAAQGPGMAYPSPGMGYPQQGMGYPQQGMGYPQQGMGYPQQGMGYPQQGMSYPQQGMSYPQQGGYPPGYAGAGPGYAGPGPGYPGQMCSPEMMEEQMEEQHQRELEAKPSGWNPIFHKIFGSGCIACKKEKDKSTGHFKPKVAKPEAPPPPGGTLAFPHFQYVRSPRDFFMPD